MVMKSEVALHKGKKWGWSYGWKAYKFTVSLHQSGLLHW